MKISVFTTMPPGIYSGGRYLSLVLARSLARAGAEVCYVTDNAPIFDRDFTCFDEIAPIRTIVTPDFKIQDDLRSDWVVVIPTGGFNARFYNAALDHARAQKARIALLCFETPNWFASLSPFPRSPMSTESWRQVISGGGLVVTIAREGVAHALSYFGEGSPELPRRFGYWHPGLNDMAAAEAAQTARRRHKIVAFVRVEDPHKGAMDLLKLPPKLFDGQVLSLVFGRGPNPAYISALRRHFAPARRFAVEVLAQITDEEKFRLLTEARLLLFPSYFEGYGYPPVEAAWMGVPSVAYDLPVLSEVAGDAVWMAPRGDTEGFAKLIAKSLAERQPGPEISALMRVQTDMLTAGRSFLTLLYTAAPHLQPVGTLPKNIPIAASLPGLNAPARALAARYADGMELSSPLAKLSRGHLKVTGRLHGLAATARVEVGLPAQDPIAIDVKGKGDQPVAFALEAMMGSWPPLRERLELPIQLKFRDDRKVALGTIPLLPDAFAVLSDAIDGGQVAPGDTLVVATAEALFARPRLAAVLCEVVAAVGRHGGRTALVSPVTKTDPVPPAAELDLLPRFAAVVTLAPEALRAAVEAARAAGQPVLVVPELRDVVGPGQAEPSTLDLGDGESLFLFSERLAEPRVQQIRPNARRWGRRAQERGQHPSLVLLPPAPIGAIEPELARLLRRLRLRVPGLRVFVPEELAVTGADLRAGQAVPVTSLPRPELFELLSHGKVAGILPGPEAPMPEAGRLFDVYSQPLLRLDGEAASAQRVMEWCLEQDGAEAGDGSLEALLTPLLSPRGPSVSLRRLDRGPVRDAAAWRPTAAPLDSAGLDELPLVPVGDVFSLSGLRGYAGAGLLEGWSQITPRGVRIDGLQAVMAFRLAAHAAPPIRLELLLEIAPQVDPTLAIEIVLNDRSLGMVPKLRAGVVAYELPTPMAAWAAGQQTLRVRCHWTGQPNAATVIALIAIAPQTAAWQLPDLAKIRPDITRLAPRYVPGLEEAPAQQSVRFGEDAAPGFLRLVSGWSYPEPSLVWSLGRTAVAGFVPTMASAFPILLTLEGIGFAGAAGAEQARQRMLVRVGESLVAETLLPPGSLAVSLPLGQSMIRGGISQLTLGLPDAISPRDAGMPSEDSRDLALALISASAVKMSRQLGQVSLQRPSSQPDWTLGTKLRAAPGVLRVAGSGPVPEAGRVMLSRGQVAGVPVALPDGGWEALLPLSAEALAQGPLVLLCVQTDGGAAATPTIFPETIECWAREGAEAAREEQEVDLLLLGQTAATADVRDLLSPGFQETLRLGLEPPLALPAAFSLFGETPDGELLEKGWSPSERMATWTDGSEASLRLPRPTGPAILTLEAAGFVTPSLLRQRVRLSTHAGAFATLVLHHPRMEKLRIALPPGCAPADHIMVELPDAASPKSLDISEDQRRLGLRLRSVALDPWPEADPPAPGMLEVLSGTADEALPSPIEGQMVERDGLFHVTLRGSAPAPFGIAQTSSSGQTIIARALPAPNGWQAVLVIAPDQWSAEGECPLHLLTNEADRRAVTLRLRVAAPKGSVES